MMGVGNTTNEHQFIITYVTTFGKLITLLVPRQLLHQILLYSEYAKQLTTVYMPWKLFGPACASQLPKARLTWVLER